METYKFHTLLTSHIEPARLKRITRCYPVTPAPFVYFQEGDQQWIWSANNLDGDKPNTKYMLSSLSEAKSACSIAHQVSLRGQIPILRIFSFAPGTVLRQWELGTASLRKGEVINQITAVQVGGSCCIMIVNAINIVSGLSTGAS